MPELPEVETIKRSLQPLLLGRKILDCEVFYEKIIKSHTVEEFIKEIKEAKIVNIERRGKYLKIFLNINKILLIHLRMTGRLIVTSKDEPVVKHTHLIFHLDNGSQLRFIDIRKFGTIYLLKLEELKNIRGYQLLGPEPFSEEFTLDFFKAAIKRRKKNIKVTLLDQDVVAGIGNIYADEILFSAKVSPMRKTDSLSDIELENLYMCIRKELEKGIKNRGTSFSDYVDGIGEKGSNQEHLQVYRREGKPCFKCGNKISKVKIGGRSSCYCPSCQE